MRAAVEPESRFDPLPGLKPPRDLNERLRPVGYFFAAFFLAFFAVFFFAFFAAFFAMRDLLKLFDAEHSSTLFATRFLAP